MAKHLEKLPLSGHTNGWPRTYVGRRQGLLKIQWHSNEGRGEGGGGGRGKGWGVGWGGGVDLSHDCSCESGTATKEKVVPVKPCIKAGVKTVV